MSDRETILRTIRQAQSRIRTNRILDRLAMRLSVWVGIGLFLKLVDLVWPFSPEAVRGAWIVWLLGVAGLVAWSCRLGSSARDAAAEVDRKAHLEDEVLSAWWFIDRADDSNPWINLHVHRTAEKVRKLNLSGLYPRVIPRMSILAGAGMVLLVALHFVPLSFSTGEFISGPRPPLDGIGEAETLMEEIEDLLEQADALDPDGTLEEFQALMAEAGDAEASAQDIASDLDDLQSTLDEGNLSTRGILEGLEDMAQELMAAADTASAGEALAEGNLGAAAAEFDQLSEALAGAESQSEGLAEALERAAQDARPGLDALAESLGQAAQSLESEDSQAAGEAMAEAADALRDLSDLVESQDLRNQASDRIESLAEALEGRPQGEPGEQGAGESGEGQAGEQSAPGEQGGRPGESPGESGQAGEGLEANATEGGEPAAGDSAPPGEAGAGQEATGQPGSIEGAAGGDTGLMPAGLGFSPEEKVGLATSLEVQLELEATAAAASEAPNLPPEPEEEASRQERSRIDYRSVPSELTPAQQELLNQEQIPREYRNLIREYFQAIRPPASP